jgi:hypothetical protein
MKDRKSFFLRAWRWIEDGGWRYLIFALYLISTAIIASHHAPWRDEAQAWVIARDFNPWQIIRLMPYEGTPPLWHFILFPFATAGLPYGCMFVINYLLAALAVFLIIFRSPLPNSIKILLPFSFYFFFEYSIVARNYGLNVLLLLAAAALYRQRQQKPLAYCLVLAALSWSSVLALAPAALLIFFFLLEQRGLHQKSRSALIGLGIAATFLLSAVLMLRPYPGQYFDDLSFNGLYAGARALAFSLFPIMQEFKLAPAFAWITSLGWVLLFFGLLKGWRSRLLFFGSSLWMLFVFLFKNYGEVRHFGIILITLIASWWMDSQEGKKGRKEGSERKKGASLALAFAILVMVASALYNPYFQFRYRNYLFSGAKEMAEYLKSSGLEHEEIAVLYDTNAASFSLYFPDKKFYLMQTERLGSRMLLDDIWMAKRGHSFQERKEGLLRFYRSLPEVPDSVLILMDEQPANDTDLTPIAINSRKAIKNEYFILVRLKITPEDSPLIDK